MKFSFFGVGAKKVKVGLALGGGGVRGMAHIGVIRAFEEHGIEFDFVAGTSAGSIVGAMYASGLNSYEMEKEAKKISIKDVKTSKIPFMPNKFDLFEEVLTRVIGDVEYKDLKIPFCAIATDVRGGKEIHITKGKVAKSVTGSCAVPGIFHPVAFEDHLLFDGGLMNNIPASVPKQFGCDYVVAVDVNSTRGQGTKSTKYLDLIMATIGIIMKGNSDNGYAYADVMIQPDLKRFSASKLIGIDEMIEEGYKAAIFKINEIKELYGLKTEKIKTTKNINKLSRRNKLII